MFENIYRETYAFTPQEKNIVRRYNGRHMLRKMGMNTEG